MTGSSARRALALALALDLARSLGGDDAMAQERPADNAGALFAVTAPAAETPPAAPAETGTRPIPSPWVVSETRSPVDYRPVATASAAAGPEEALRLSVHCRGGRTTLTIALAGAGVSTAASTGKAGLVMSYGIGDAAPAALGVAPSPVHDGVALRVDALGFLRALPARGEMRLIATLPDRVIEGRFALDALKAALNRLERPCGWPAATAP